MLALVLAGVLFSSNTLVHAEGVINSENVSGTETFVSEENEGQEDQGEQNQETPAQEEESTETKEEEISGAEENEVSEERGETDEAQGSESAEDEAVMDERTAELVQQYWELLNEPVTYGATTGSYEEELAKFPSDYQALLSELHKKYPNWIFVAVNTGLEWNDVVTGESKGTRSLTSLSYSDILLRKDSDSYNASTGKYIPKDGSTWVNVSKPGVAYFVDPRNYLNEQYIFAMEYQGYDQSRHTLTGVESILAGTNLANKNITYTDTNGKTVTVSPATTYGATIFAAGIKYGISPLSLAARIRQETGGSLSYGSISGNFSYNNKSYRGYYNYYNIGATATTTGSAVANGLEFAMKNEVSYSRPWTSPVLAINGGADYLASGYISKGQNTIYTQKFNTVCKPYYSHQYMQNIAAPMSEGNKTYSSYSKIGGLQNSFVFYIPVYKNMPSQTAGVTISKSVDTAKTTGDVTMRKGPSTSYASVTSIPKGATITVSGGVFTDDSVAYGQKLVNPYWLKVTYGKYSGYISSNYFEMNSSTTIKAGATTTLKLSSAPSGEKIYYETSDPAVATVSDSGVVTGVGGGNCMIYAVTSSGQSLDAIGITVEPINLATVKLGSVKNAKSGVTVTWNAVSGAAGYYVYHKVSGGSWKRIATITSGSTLSYTDTAVSSGTSYIYTVKAYAGSKYGGYDKNGLSILRLSQPTLSISSKSATAVKLKWSKVSGAKGYYVYRRSGTSGNWSRIATIKSGSTLTYTYKARSTAEKEYFTVKAYNGSTCGSYPNPGTLGRTAPAIPTLTGVKNAASGITVTWSKTSGAAGYYVYRKVSGGSWKRIATIKSASTTSYTDTKATSGTTYTYTVKAYSGSMYGNYNKTGKTLLRLSQPTLSVSSCTATSVKVGWSKVSGATGYYVYHRTGTSGGWTRIANIMNVNTLSYTYRASAVSANDYFTVKAYKGSVYSSYPSPGISATAKSAAYTTYKTTASVNYRTGAGTSYGKGGSLAKGATVKVENGYSKKANGYTWYRIKIGSKNYYVASSYLKKA